MIPTNKIYQFKNSFNDDNLLKNTSYEYITSLPDG